MLELIPTNKTEHPRFAIHGVCFKDWQPRVRVASPDESGKLVAQGAHRVRVSDVNHLNIAIGLVEREKRRARAPWSSNLPERSRKIPEHTASLTVKAPHKCWRFAFRYGSLERLDWNFFS
jgi:hypothetical protein